MERLNKSEIVFKILSYVLVVVFSVIALYPLVYAFSASISGRIAYETGSIVLFPKQIQFDTYIKLLNDNGFWVTYTNTLFYTLFGTAWSMFISVIGAYALAKRKLLFRKQFNFIVVFTMWFSAGVVQTYLNYQRMFELFHLSSRWGMIFAFGTTAYNIILLRSYFESIPKELEEAATLDGCGQAKMLVNLYLPLSKAPLATVTLFYAVARWNGYFWSMMLLSDSADWPLQVYMKTLIQDYESKVDGISSVIFAPQSYVYAILICSIVPVLIIYPFISKYFAKGVTVGGVKE